MLAFKKVNCSKLYSISLSHPTHSSPLQSNPRARHDCVLTGLTYSSAISVGLEPQPKSQHSKFWSSAECVQAYILRDQALSPSFTWLARLSSFPNSCYFGTQNNPTGRQPRQKAEQTLCTISLGFIKAQESFLHALELF